MATKSAAKTAERAVLVTTAHRGVFFGYAAKASGPTIKLKRARLCIYWSSDLHGFMGLASHGPNSNCKIGPAADIELFNITSIVEVAPIRELFSDTSVSRSTTKRNLQSVKDEVDILLD